MYTFKLLDIVLQGFAFLAAFILLLTFDVFGYFYWIRVGIILWILISIIINLAIYRPLSAFRVIFSIILVISFLIFSIFYFLQTLVPELNFYFQGLSYFIIIGYLVLSLIELKKIKEKGEIDADF